MTKSVSPALDRAWLDASKTLTSTAQFWYVVAIAGHLIFVAYIFGFYWVSALQGDFRSWSQVLPQGMIKGDLSGNIALASHILIAAIISFSGPLQLLPSVRSRWPVFHRWNGRVYMFTAIIMSLSGLYLVLTRGTVGNAVQHIAISLNALLILIFAAIALRKILIRDIDSHRRWAMRLFLVVSGVWFFRIGLMCWMLIHQKPVGIDFETFTGPFLYFLAFAQYLLPLAILELYFWAQRDSRVSVKFSVAGVLFIAALLTGLGIFGATLGLWFPRLQG